MVDLLMQSQQAALRADVITNKTMKLLLENNKQSYINCQKKFWQLLKYFFNLKQKYILKYSFFKPKSYVMYKLMEN